MPKATEEEILAYKEEIAREDLVIEQTKQDAADKSGYYDGLLSGLSNSEPARLRWLAGKRFPEAEEMGLDPIEYGNYFIGKDGDIRYQDPVTGAFKDEFVEGRFGVGADSVTGSIFPAAQFASELIGGVGGLIAGGLAYGVPGAIAGGSSGTAVGGSTMYGVRAGLSQMLDGPKLETEKMITDLSISSAAGGIPFGAPAKSLPRFAENISSRFLGVDGRNKLQTIIKEGGETADDKIAFTQKKYGITLTRPEAQRVVSEGSQLQKYLQVQPSSQNLWNFYNQRNLQVQEIADDFFTEISSGKYVRGEVKDKLTGKVGIDEDIDVARASQAVLKKLADKRSKRAGRVYKQAYELDVKIDVSDILSDIKKVIADPNTSPTKMKAYKEMERGLTDQTTKQARNTTELLHNSLQDDFGNVIASLTGKDKSQKLKREVSVIRDKINLRLREANPTFARGNDIFNPSKGHMQVLDRSIINAFADVVEKGGQNAARISKKLFSGNAKPREIQQLKKLLQAEFVDKEGVTRSGASAWQNLKGTWLQTQFDDAVVGTANPLNSPNKFLQKIGIRGDVRTAFPSMTGRYNVDEVVQARAIGKKARMWEAILEPDELKNFVDFTDTLQSITYIATQSQSPTQPLMAMSKIMEKEGTKGLAKFKTYALGMFNIVPRALNQGTSDITQKILSSQQEIYQDLIVDALINPKKAAELRVFLDNIQPATYLMTQTFARSGVEGLNRLADSPDLRNQAILNEQKDFADKQLLEEHKQQENKKQEIENLQGSIDNFQMPQAQGSMFNAPPPSMAPPPTLAPQQMVSPTLLPNEDDREIAMRQQAGIAGLV